MNSNELLSFHSWFHSHVKSYYSEDNYIQANIRLKEEHTHRVCKNILVIGKDLKLNENQLRLAETIALFHDIGRFEQFKRYRTFNDRFSENHAKLSVKILKQTKLLAEVSGKEQTIIYKSIEYHNVYKLPADGSDWLFYAELLRDADKLDILFVVTDYYEKRDFSQNPAIELELPNKSGYSSQIIDDIMSCRCADNSHMHTLNDMKILQLSWIFSINFLPTYRYIQEYGYIDKIIACLPDTEEIKKVQRHINRYIKQKLMEEIL